MTRISLKSADPHLLALPGFLRQWLLNRKKSKPQVNTVFRSDNLQILQEKISLLHVHIKTFYPEPSGNQSSSTQQQKMKLSPLLNLLPLERQLAMIVSQCL